MRPFVVLLLIGTLLAGCADKPAAAAAKETVASSAPPVVTTEVGGSIHGLVVDDELKPLANIEVGLVGTEHKQKTAQNGEFTFNEVPAGTHTLSAGGLGYVSAGQKVDVLDGEVSEVKFTLKAIEIQGEFYADVYNFVFFMQFDWFGVGQTTAVHPYLCNPCDAYQTIAKGASAAFLEATWVKSVPAPLFSESMNWNVYTKPTNDTFVTGESVIDTTLSNREGAMAEEGGIGRLAKADLISVQVLSGGLTQIAFQQRADAWLTIGYNGPIAEGYSALPPP